jgi:3-deoxy-7-phosphoheptulonate synthase
MRSKLNIFPKSQRSYINLNKFDNIFFIPPKIKQNIKQHRQEIANILENKDSRLLLIVGPCVAWPANAVIEYCHKISELEQKIDSKIKIIIRVFTQKPRTSLGWTGPFFQPEPWGEPNIEQGILYTRNLYMKIAELGLAVGCEIVSTHSISYIHDLISWGVIGARNSESPDHRILASGIELPIGMKNPTSGNIEYGVNAVLVAHNPHNWIFFGQKHKTKGNPLAHLVLRGGKHTGPNYKNKNILDAVALHKKYRLHRYPIIIDASHDNTLINQKRDYQQQKIVIKETLQNMKKNPVIKRAIKGFMIESFLNGGKINYNNIIKNKKHNTTGTSVMDPCLSWADTKKIILDIFNYLEQQKNN